MIYFFFLGRETISAELGVVLCPPQLEQELENLLLKGSDRRHSFI